MFRVALRRQRGEKVGEVKPAEHHFRLKEDEVNCGSTLSSQVRVQEVGGNIYCALSFSVLSANSLETKLSAQGPDLSAGLVTHLLLGVRLVLVFTPSTH